MKHKNYYEILEVSEDATPSQIKRAYYSLCKQYHPDINPKTGNLFRNINEAYQTLIDPVKREEYDRSLRPEENATYSEQEETYSDFYYTNASYYQDLDKEPILHILKDFSEYKFENAIKAIWNRNWFVLFGNTILYFMIALCILSNRVAKLFKKTVIPNKKPKIFKGIYKNIESNQLFSFIKWFGFLSIITIFKFISICFKIVCFICGKIIKPLLIPVSIIICGLFLSNSNGLYNNFYAKKRK